MEDMKKNLRKFLKNNNLSPMLYIAGGAIYVLTLFALIAIEYRPAFSVSKLMMFVVSSLFILGNILSFLKKETKDKARYNNIVFIVAILTVLISKYFL